MGLQESGHDRAISFSLIEEHLASPSLLISWWLLLAKFALFLFLFLQFPRLHGTRKPNSYFRVYPLGLSRRGYCGPLLFWLFLFNVPRPPSLGTFSSSWPLSLTPTSTHPCISFSSTYLFQTSVSPLPPSQRCCGTSNSESSYHLWRLHRTDVFLHALGC